MTNTPATRLIPVQQVRAVEGRDDRWCGHVTLPGDSASRHVLIVHHKDELIAVPANCPHEGVSLANSEMDETGKLVCPAHGQLVPMDENNENYRVNEIAGEFFIIPPGSFVEGRSDDELVRLRQEVISLRQANTALQSQVLNVSDQVEHVLDELSQKSNALQRQSDEQRRLSAFVNRVVDTMDGLLVVLDARGMVMQVNAAGCKALGYTAQDLEGQSADRLIEPQQLAELSVTGNGSSYPEGLVLFRRTVGEDSMQLEVNLQPKKHPMPHPRFLLRGSPIYDRAGKLEGAVIVGSDVTSLRQREQALIESEKRFRDYSQVSSDFFWQTDESHILFGTAEGTSLTNSASSPLSPGHHPKEFAPPEDLDSKAIPWREHLDDIAAQRPFRDFECRFHAESDLVWMSVSGKPVYDRQGVFQGYRGTAKDITERRQMEDELRMHRDHLSEMVEERTLDLLKAKEEAERANRMKSEFIANVSHEFRTPLHAILSFAGFGNKRLNEAPLEKLGSYFQRIEESGSRLSRMVNDLLDLAKLEAGHQPPDPKPTDIVELEESLRRQLDGLIASKSIQVDVQTATDNRMAEVDPDQFSQVILNLLSNAIKFTPHDSRILIRFDDAADTAALRFSIADQGPGIPEDELESVFDKFEQSSKTKTGAGGTGLGLAICREIVTRHKGTIHASNNEEGGATFIVEVPRATSGEGKVAPKKHAFLF
ncbi:ATP-binding protein [Thiosocius teredinicola]|uniref:ATP-binding protein n=1 Tax=Thiosocius teredinicola TaxID=1973002 RepID=UPI000990F792